MTTESKANININVNELGCIDLASLANVINFLSDNNITSEITEIAYNNQSGNVYAYIEDTNTVVYSGFGKAVEFMTYGEDGEEVDISVVEFLKENK